MSNASNPPSQEQIKGKIQRIIDLISEIESEFADPPGTPLACFVGLPLTVNMEIMTYEQGLDLSYLVLKESQRLLRDKNNLAPGSVSP